MKDIRFYKNDKLIVSFSYAGVEIGDKIVKDNFVLFVGKFKKPVLFKDGKRYYKYDRFEVVEE